MSNAALVHWSSVSRTKVAFRGILRVACIVLRVFWDASLSCRPLTLHRFGGGTGGLSTASIVRVLLCVVTLSGFGGN